MCPGAVPCSYAPYRTPGSPWRETCIKHLWKPVLVSGAFRHCLMSKKKKMRKVEGHYHWCWAAASSLGWQWSSLFSQGLGYHSHICVLHLAVWSLLRGELILLEQEVSSAAFERSQTGAWCQKKDDAEQTVVAAARIDWGLGQRAFPGLHCKASPRV